jgi:hypothetical protein
MNMIAWAIVNPSAGTKPGAKLVQLALELARRADQKTDGKNGQIADTLARTYFDSGDVARAIETQERAVRLSKQGRVPAKQLDEMEERLEEYKKAARK